MRVVVLDHTGRVFCSGMDLSEAAGGGAEEQGVREFPELLRGVWSSPKPVRRRRARAGAGRRGRACWPPATSSSPAPSATFAFSEVRLGIVPAVISAVVLPRMLPHVAHRLMLTGEVFDAAAAAAGGLVDLVVPDDDVDASVAGAAARTGRRGARRAGRDQAAAARPARRR